MQKVYVINLLISYFFLKRELYVYGRSDIGSFIKMLNNIIKNR